MTKQKSFAATIKPIAMLCVASAAFWPATAQTPSMALLDRMTAGQWEIRDRDGGSAKRLCLKSGRDLLLMRHRGQNCKRIAVESDQAQVTVQFTCRNNGYGRTSIRRETASLVQIDGQGISNNKPYEFSAEARRVGGC